ncbi:MAG: phage SIR2-like domain protein [Bacteroidetes bacterium HLUCCA01]|nr:MAG: phage SIR2-like domain protein [Bacteroidetes bacterium HLUCCA01]
MDSEQILVSEAAQLDDLAPLRVPAFAKALDDLDDLLTQNSKAFLIGAGCSKCAGLPLMEELTKKTLASTKLSTTTKSILSVIERLFAGANTANIEDYLSELVDLVAIAERRGIRGATSQMATLGGVDYTAEKLKDSVDEIKSAIVEVIDVPVSMEVHLKFIQAIHRPSRPGRMVATRPVDYLLLNYDALIESALALQKLRYADGMNGGSTAWWDLSTFNAEGLSARVIKLHGSIDWKEMSGQPLPRRVEKNLNLPTGIEQKVLIWPASTKYRETQRDPYAQLSSLARSALRPPSGCQTVLTICGYSFGDSHINIEIEQALRESKGELTLVVFTFDEEPVGFLKKLHEDKAISDQIRIYARKGFFHGSTVFKSEEDLPWYKFENITRIMGGER